MRSKAKIFGHPIHPMLIAFPVTFYVSTFVCYLVYQNSGDPFWFRMGVIANIAGVVMAVVAAIPGIIDWVAAIPKNTYAKQTGAWHMTLNTIALVLFAVSASVNFDKWLESAPNIGLTLLLSGLGVLTTIGAGFYGWTMVQKYHVGVDLAPEQQYLESNRKQKVFSSEPLNPGRV